LSSEKQDSGFGIRDSGRPFIHTKAGFRIQESGFRKSLAEFTATAFLVSRFEQPGPIPPGLGSCEETASR
jgi:hypothetical protein